ncbi:MAG: ribosome biogenesis GTPase [Polyangiales bacterium]|jgi:ribosome biogenesis GTPase
MSSELGLVIRAAGGFYDVCLHRTQETHRCRLRGRLKQQKRRTDLIVIGDEVRVELGDEATVEEIFERRTVFSRRHPGRGGEHKEDVLVANLEVLFAVFAHGSPPFRPRLLDRFLVVAEHNNLEAVVIANKQDQRTDETNALFAPYADLGYPIIETCATDGSELASLRAKLDGRIAAFVGPSGVGKSSLLNALDETLALRVGALSESHGKGRHTTRVATLHTLAGGFIADTPGIRELGAWELEPKDLDRCFVEMREFLGHCAFGDCVHHHEPRCAVKEQVGQAISEERYESYLRLLLPEE